MTNEQAASRFEHDYECYENVAATIGVIGGKWKMLIMWHVNQGSIRYNELRRSIPGISQKMLSQQLKELEQDGIIHREVYPETPPRVEYNITDYGHTLDPIFDLMDAWGETHRQTVGRGRTP
ncbi:winged helix-turn-helix transcriptional regulator [Paenibacillus arenilitoris]|uniref:Helix-turn-helix transcriptional regulator n=1 Tax=Paenibacillus arenilitoris TaxID=2772299 RepID=A0A927CRF3_9BACL|nr:helix-turn-helix domain-containing protein [Paenibacillus arenilitoris]MBD2870265.1 helix-turn-helix transcriptional regulator [Paenibacillus arenilitoris]